MLSSGGTTTKSSKVNTTNGHAVGRAHLDRVAGDFDHGGGAGKALCPRSATTGALGARVSIHDEITFLDHASRTEPISARGRR